MRDSQLRESLNSSWSSKIFEIGDPRHAIAPIDWELIQKSGRVTKYKFFLDTETEYLVQFTQTSDTYPTKNVDVEFYANGDRDSVTNEGQPLRVMSTVIGIVKEYLADNPEIGSFSFVPSQADYEDERRLKLYLRYIKGHLGNPRITKESLGRGYVSIKVILNKLVEESLKSHVKKSKFRVGQMVRVGKSIGKIIFYRRGNYGVLVGSTQRICSEGELKSLKTKAKGVNEEFVIGKKLVELDNFLNLVYNSDGTLRHPELFEETLKQYLIPRKPPLTLEEEEKVKVKLNELKADMLKMFLDKSGRKNKKIIYAKEVRALLKLVIAQLNKYPTIPPEALPVEYRNDPEMSTVLVSDYSSKALDYLTGEKSSMATGFMGFMGS
jgi:hypothetical protein